MTQTSIQARYQQHRRTRNHQQKDKILSPDFPGWILDDVLTKLDGHSKQLDYVDPRNCLVLWARPTQKVKNLIEVVQQKLRSVAPGIWLMPLDNLHMTAMEVTHSQTAEQIEQLVQKLMPESKTLADLPSSPGHRARLIKPLLSYDSAALALSYVPAAGEVLTHSSRQSSEDEYTYHHLRRDLHGMISEAGVPVGSRYVVPSAHLTIARFNSPNPFNTENWSDPAAGIEISKRSKWMREINTINSWLEAEFWPKSGTEETIEQHVKPGGEWIVGDEKGLDFRKGRLWCKSVPHIFSHTDNE